MALFNSKRLNALLKGITSKHDGDLYCLNCFHSYASKESLEKHMKVCEDKDYCYIEMPKKSESSKYQSGIKSMKSPFIIVADIEPLLKKMDTCSNDPDKSATNKINKHEMSGYSLFTSCSFNEKNNVIDHYRGKDCLKKFCQGLKKQAIKKIVNFEEKEMIELKEGEMYRHYINKRCFLCKGKFNENNDDSSNKKHNNNYIKVRDHCHYTGKYRGATHKMCNLRYNTPREIPVVCHNGSSYDYHIVIKGLAEEFEGDFECLGENKEKHITFSVPIKKESNEDGTIIYRIKFIDSFRFMSPSLTNLVDNLSNKVLDYGKCDSCDSKLEYIGIRKSYKLVFECFNCKRRYLKKISEEIIKELTTNFKNTYRFSNGEIGKFLLLLRKGVYPYEYMDDWDRFDEEKLPDKRDFYSSLNMEEISEIDYRHAKKVFNKFNIKHLGEYHDLYVQSDTLLLADVFENFRNICLKIYELDPAYFLSMPGFAWTACFKRTGVKLGLINGVDMLLMIEEGIRGGIYHSIHRHAVANNKYMKDYDKNKESSYIIYGDYNNLYGWALIQKLPVDGFEWIDDR